MWLTTDNDLIEFDGRAFHLHDDTQGLPAGMTQMAEDAAGNLWIGGRAALLRLDRYGDGLQKLTDWQHEVRGSAKAQTAHLFRARQFRSGSF